MGSLRSLGKILAVSSLIGVSVNFIFFAPSTGDFGGLLSEETPSLVEPAESDNLVSPEDIISLFRNSGQAQIEGAVLSEEALVEASRDQEGHWILLGSIFDEEQAKAFVLSWQGEVIELVVGQEFGGKNRVKGISFDSLRYENEKKETLTLELYSKKSRGSSEEI